jgi:predicted nucleotidyltransferase component of viral defense system
VVRNGTSWVTYVGPLGAKPRRLKLDISDTELVESHGSIALQPRWPDLPEGTTIQGYTLDEVAAEKVRCIAERLQCRDLYDMHVLLDRGQVDPLEVWQLYLRKAANDELRGRRRTPPREWSATFDRRMDSYRDRWDAELGDYLPGEIPAFADVERRTRRQLAALLDAARSWSG